MLTYKIFLASSSELAADRVAFGDMVQELNDRMIGQNKNVRFTLYKWERDMASFAERRKQDEYNDNIENCHIFVMLYGSKVGMYTEEEYDFAYGRFKTTGAPQVLVFKSTGFTDVADSVTVFQEKVSDRDKQYKSGEYADAGSLKIQFTEEVYKYFTNGILKAGIPATTIYSDGQSIPPIFIGRTEELKAIREKLDRGGKLMLINAEGGIGKTTLAAKYWEESLYDYQHNAWLFCENGIVNELKKLAPGLNLDLTNMNEEEQIAALKNALQNISHHFLLVLDNANSDKHIEAFKQTFRGFHWHVLITSRRKGVLEKEQEYEITHLPPSLAKDFFISNYKEEGPEFDALLDRLLQAIGYHTLLVEIFSKNMRELRMRGETLKDFLVQLETKGLFLDERSFQVPTDYTLNRHKDAPNTDAILNILYDFTELTEEERYYLVNMALLPAVPHLFPFLCDIFSQNVFQFNTLKDLARKGWLGIDDTTYRISPVIQKLVLEKHQANLQEDAKALIKTLNIKLKNDGYYLENFNGAGRYAVLAESITQQLIRQPFHELNQLNFNVCTYYTSTGDLFKASDYAKMVEAISKKLNDKNGLSLSYQKQGNIFREMGKLLEASKLYEESKKLMEELHDEHPDDTSLTKNFAICYERLGNIYQKLDRLPEALRFYEHYKRLMEKLHQDYLSDLSFKNGLAVSYEKLGGINEMLDRLPEALQFYEVESKLFKELHQDYPNYMSFKNGIAVSCQNLGIINEKLDRLPEALKFYEEYKILIEELHRDYPDDVSFKNSLAISYIKIAGTVLQQGNKQQAISLYVQAENICQQLADQFPKYAEFTTTLGWVQQKLATLQE